MRVGILGSGLMGSKLETIFARAGHEVVFRLCAERGEAEEARARGSEALAKKVSGAQVVAAFNTVPSEVLFDVFEARGHATRPSLVYCGDKQSGKRVAATLIRDAGFDPVDAGPLRIARSTEPFGLLVGQLAYEGEGGAELAYRFERFGR